MAATHTPNINLAKPDRQDFVSVVADINDNMDKIDTSVGNLNTDKVNKSDIVNNLTTNDPTKVLSAAQGYALNSKFRQISSGSFHDIKEPGVYWLSSAVTDKPNNSAGTYILNRLNNDYLSGIYVVADDAKAYSVKLSNNTWKYEALASVSQTCDYSYADIVKYGSLWESGLIRAHRRGYVVTLKLDGMTIAAVSGGRQQIGTIPEGYRPVTETAFYDDTNTRQFIITTSGVVQASPQSAGKMWGSVTYVCNK